MTDDSAKAAKAASASGPGPRFTDLVQALPAAVPFVGPDTMERQSGQTFRVRLGANENGFGPSPLAIRAMQDAVAEVWKYGDGESHDLRAALSKHLDVPMANLLVGEGIDGLLGVLVRLTVAPGDRVVTSAGAYPTFNYHVTGHGGELVTRPYVEDREDPTSLFAAARDSGAKLVYLANPDNPMGTWHEGPALERALNDLPTGTTLVLDEAYIEFAPKGTAAPIAPRIDPEDGRVIRMRTFSKAYGLAGARIGYIIAPAHVIEAFHKLRNHFGVNRLAQAGALAALKDQAHLDWVVDQVARARERLAAIAADEGLHALPSAANFVAIDCGGDPDPDGKMLAHRVLGALNRRGVFVRMPFVAPQNRCIRVTCGTPEDLDLFTREFPPALAEARAEHAAQVAG